MEVSLEFLAGFGLGTAAVLAAQRLILWYVRREIMKMRGAKGKAVETENKEELQQALMEVAAEVQAGKTPQEALKAVALQHPQLAMKLAKRFGIGV